jgi:hypothetical protein
MPSGEAEEARQKAVEEREAAEIHYRAETLPKMEEALKVFRRLRDHSRADTFTAMIQHELTRREEVNGL